MPVGSGIIGRAAVVAGPGGSLLSRNDRRGETLQIGESPHQLRIRNPLFRHLGAGDGLAVYSSVTCFVSPGSSET